MKRAVCKSAIALLFGAVTGWADSPGIIHYQGRLVLGTNLYSGPVSLVFLLYDAPTGGTLLHSSTNLAIAVDGLYATAIGEHGVMGDLDAALTNNEVWLELKVNGTILSPRERMLSVPYARAVRGLRIVDTNNIILNAEMGTNQIIESIHSAIGGGLGNRIDTAWNATIAGGFQNIIQPLADYTSIGGGYANVIQSNAIYATIAGGFQNSIYRGASFATIGAGSDNSIRDFSSFATIAGGYNNIIQQAHRATIAGGSFNLVHTNADSATISGGSGNLIGLWAEYATVGGGNYNIIQQNADSSIIGGGYLNFIQTNAFFATIPGGFRNRVESFATNAFAAGRRAIASHRGAFVWGDDNDLDVVSTADNQVTFRASGGYRIFTSSAMTSGVSVAAGSGSWTSISDVNAKEDFAPVDTREVLERVAALPITTWRYKGQDSNIRHMGPMAQDFYAAFGLGDMPGTGITTIDADGVLFAAVQALARENETIRRENEELRRRLEALEARFKNF